MKKPISWLPLILLLIASGAAHAQAQTGSLLPHFEALEALNDPKLRPLIEQLKQIEGTPSIHRPKGGHGSSAQDTADATQPSKRWSQLASIRFQCSAQGTRSSRAEYALEISHCHALDSSDPTTMALNGRVFQGFSVRISGQEDAVREALGRALERHTVQRKLNPSSDRSAEFKIETFTETAQQTGQVASGPSSPSSHPETSRERSVSVTFTGQVEHFAGERLPITATDKKVLPILFNIRSYVEAKAAILKDIETIIRENSVRAPSFDYSNESKWPIGLGAGHASRGVFELLRAYYEKAGPSGLVVYRSTQVNTRWVRSQFEGDDQHRLTTVSANVGLEYYWVPGSYLFVYRMIPQGEDSSADPNDPSFYAVALAEPPVWLLSFSAHDPRGKNVTTSFTILQRYGKDLAEIMKVTGNVTSSGVRFGLNERFTEYTMRFWFEAPKLY